MPSRQPKLVLGESWVVEGQIQDDSSDYSPRSYDENRDWRSSPRRSPRSSNSSRSPEPELIMPSLDKETLDASWEGHVSRSARLQRSNRYVENGREARRRSVVTNGPPEKRLQRRSRPMQKDMSSPMHSTPVRAADSEGPGDAQEMLELVVNHLLATLSYLLDILGGAFRVLKTPISYILAVWVLFGLGLMLRTLVTNSIYASLSPVCRLPGVSFLNLPFCPVHRIDSKNGPPPPVEFEQLMEVQSKFEEVLEESAGGVSLPLDMKRGEASIRDLRQLVRYSTLRSKGELVLEFDGFIDTARAASYDLQKFNSHVGRAVDSVIATTRWTTRVLDGINEREASRGLISSFSDKILAPFQPLKFTESILLDQYIQHTRIVEEEINKLISEAQALLMILNNLEDRLDIIHGVATREDLHSRAMRDEILSDLWTMVGGNRHKLDKMDRQLALLHQVAHYRKTAYAHVSGTLIRLQAIGADLEDLRERVGSPELLRDRVDIPLSVHIENINRGVERLESRRSQSRRVEHEQIQKTLDRAGGEGILIEA
ncbi:hypothetical protein F5884DRAFT_899477 [Xylogone sp. PMI_703]|nr:hypothetical protein F5884DRAFT_899477 [Xylogone sp. PMI_703]